MPQAQHRPQPGPPVPPEIRRGVPDELRQDPSYFRSKGEHVGRDGCRVPLPWKGGTPGNGFGPSALVWLPQPAIYGELAVDRQVGVKGSTLELYRTLLRLRRDLNLGHGTITVPEQPDPSLLVIHRVVGGDDLSVMTNFGELPVDLPAGKDILVASGQLIDGMLPQDTTVWLR